MHSWNWYARFVCHSPWPFNCPTILYARLCIEGHLVMTRIIVIRLINCYWNSQACDKIPSKLFITGVKLVMKDIAGEGFANIHRGSYRGVHVALKSVWIFQTSPDHQVQKIQQVQRLYQYYLVDVNLTLELTGSVSWGPWMAKPQPSICSAVSRHEFGDFSVSVPMHCTALDVQWHDNAVYKTWEHF